MTEQKKDRTPRMPRSSVGVTAAQTEERGFILTKKDGSEQLVMALDVRVAKEADLFKALASKTEAVS